MFYRIVCRGSVGGDLEGLDQVIIGSQFLDDFQQFRKSFFKVNVFATNVLQLARVLDDADVAAGQAK
jgi:hypothetical protein